MPTIEEVAEARKVLSEVENGGYWPKGSNLISKNYDFVFNIANDKLFCVSRWRELTASELELLKQIPEIAKVLK